MKSFLVLCAFLCVAINGAQSASFGFRNGRGIDTAEVPVSEEIVNEVVAELKKEEPIVAAIVEAVIKDDVAVPVEALRIAEPTITVQETAGVLSNNKDTKTVQLAAEPIVVIKSVPEEAVPANVEKTEAVTPLRTVPAVINEEAVIAVPTQIATETIVLKQAIIETETPIAAKVSEVAETEVLPAEETVAEVVAETPVKSVVLEDNSEGTFREATPVEEQAQTLVQQAAHAAQTVTEVLTKPIANAINTLRARGDGDVVHDEVTTTTHRPVGVFQALANTAQNIGGAFPIFPRRTTTTTLAPAGSTEVPAPSAAVTAAPITAAPATIAPVTVASITAAPGSAAIVEAKPQVAVKPEASVSVGGEAVASA